VVETSKDITNSETAKVGEGLLRKKTKPTKKGLILCFNENRFCFLFVTPCHQLCFSTQSERMVVRFKGKKTI